MSKASFDADWIPPPGATIEDLFSRRTGLSSKSLIASRLGEVQMEKLLRGQYQIDSSLAAFLADHLGLSASFWLERERLYRAALRQRQLERELLEELPLDDMRGRGMIKPLYSHAETVAEVVEFFGGDGPEGCYQHIQQLPTSIKQKTSRVIVSRRGSLAAWVRAGELEASRVECANWNRDRVQEILPEVRKLTRIEDPGRYLPVLKTLCQRAGIALVVLRALGGCSARGVVKFVSPTKVMMLLSCRHLSDDQFWFSVFHELAHLLRHAESHTLIDDWDDSVTAEEIEVDRFAADTLIPPEFQAELSALRDDRSIIRFARQVGVSRGILVGQMQHRGILAFDKFNHLKTYYRWSADNRIEKKPG